MADRWRVRYKPAARRALEAELPEAVGAAAFELITGAIADNPHRVGRPLAEPYDGLYAARRGTYRVIYRIVTDLHVVEVYSIRHRLDAYRS